MRGRVPTGEDPVSAPPELARRRFHPQAFEHGSTSTRTTRTTSITARSQGHSHSTAAIVVSKSSVDDYKSRIDWQGHATGSHNPVRSDSATSEQLFRLSQQPPPFAPQPEGLLQPYLDRAQHGSVDKFYPLAYTGAFLIHPHFDARLQPSRTAPPPPPRLPPQLPPRNPLRLGRDRPSSSFCSHYIVPTEPYSSSPSSPPSSSSSSEALSSQMNWPGGQYGRHDGPVRPAAIEVSPPSSPEFMASRYGAEVSPEVSPIDEVSPISHHYTSPHQYQHVGGGPRLEPAAVSHGTQDAEVPKLAVPQPANHRQTKLPVRRRESPSLHKLGDRQAPSFPTSDASITDLHLGMKDATKWDAYSGEPSVSGKDGQVHPGDFTQGLAQQTLRGAQGVLRKLRPVGDRLGANQQRQVVPVEERPEWKGASGRTVIMKPMRDAPNNTRKYSPDAKSNANVNYEKAESPLFGLGGSPRSMAGPAVTDRSPKSLSVKHTVHSPAYTASPQSSPVAEDSQFSTSQQLQSPVSPEWFYPSPQSPHSLQYNRPDSQSVSGITTRSQATATADAWKASHLQTPQDRHPQPFEPSQLPTPITPTVLRTASPTKAAMLTPNISFPARDDGRDQPPSRFSATTRDTTTTTTTTTNAGFPEQSVDNTAHKSPSNSPPPVSPRQQTTSILDRKRPKIGSYSAPQTPTSEPIVISVSRWRSPVVRDEEESPLKFKTRLDGSDKPASPPASPPLRESSPVDTPVSSTSAGNDKALPRAPPEILSETTGDRVGQLNARLEALANRRINIHRSIIQITELMPQDNLMASEAVLRKREAEKCKVEALKTELADVQRQEYEIGLKLYRARKRQDEDASFEPTTLWVRRVTDRNLDDLR